MAVKKETLNNLQKTFGKESVMKMSDNLQLDLDWIKTGSLFLDNILGGGFPRGRIVEIYGPESAGKTTSVIHAIAEAQKQGLNVGFIDAEHAFDPEYASHLGVDVDELLISQPDNAEQALDMAIAMVESADIQVVAVDSTNALSPKAELEGEMGDNSVALQARLLSKALRKITGAAKKNNCLVIFISQIRIKVGVLYGSPESVGVGNALKFYASQRIDIRKSSPTMEDGNAVGHNMKFKIVKNKVSPPFKTCEVALRYGQGYDKEEELIDMCVELGIIERKGSHYYFDGTKLGNGKKNVKDTLRDNQEVTDILKDTCEDVLKSAV